MISEQLPDIRSSDLDLRDTELREAVTTILRDEIDWKGPLPEGEIGRHLDSLQCMALIVAIEDRFQICFEPEDERGILTMNDLLGCVAGKLNTPEARQ